MNCLKNHSRLHSNIYYNCDMCSSRFKGKHELRCHMDAIHLGKKDHICQICGKAFSRDKTLRQHLMYHLNERNIVCEVCGFKTVNKPKMTRHMKSHTGERNYEVSWSTMSLAWGLLTSHLVIIVVFHLWQEVLVQLQRHGSHQACTLPREATDDQRREARLHDLRKGLLRLSTY